MAKLAAIPLRYSVEQTVTENDSFSPSAGKPELVVDAFVNGGFPVKVRKTKPVTKKEISAAHSADYVRGVLACQLQNGFGNTLQTIAKSLRWTSGSLVGAALDALKNGQVAMSPTSGFHHAEYDSGMGYCTFNGLMVTAQKLKAEGKIDRIGILDLDQHYGNGTDDIIEELDLDYVEHYTLGGPDIGPRPISPRNAEKWLDELPQIIEDKFADVDLVLYQAGADPHVDDPLGGRLTTAQMARRDQIVFDTLKELGVPVAWNLAGGYQDPIENVIDLHRNTMAACAATYVDPKFAEQIVWE